jgi:hypothetical protein
MHAVKDGSAYCVRAESYMRKMFMKSTTGVNVTKLFFNASQGQTPQLIWVIIY